MLPQLVEQPAPFFSELGGGGGIAGQELDVDGIEGRSMFASRIPPPRSASSARASARIARASSKRPSIASASARYARRQWSRPARASCSSSHASSSETGVVPKKRPAARHSRNSWRQARPPSMGDGPLECLQRRVHLPAHVRHLPERGVSDVQGEVVAGGLEHGQRLLDERGQLLGRALRLEEDAEDARLDPPAQLADAIARRRGPLGEGIRAPERFAALACPEQGVDELGLEGEVDLGRGHERGGALEQAHGGAVVLAGAARGGRPAVRRRRAAAASSSSSGSPSSAR